MMCPFDERIDEYPDHYRVYQLDKALLPTLDTISWESLASTGAVDPTRRAAIGDAVFDLI